MISGKNLHTVCPVVWILGCSHLIWDSGTKTSSPKQAVRCWVLMCPSECSNHGSSPQKCNTGWVKSSTIVFNFKGPSVSCWKNYNSMLEGSCFPLQFCLQHSGHCHLSAGFAVTLLEVAVQDCTGVAPLLLLWEQCNWKLLGKISHNTEVPAGIMKACYFLILKISVLRRWDPFCFLFR